MIRPEGAADERALVGTAADTQRSAILAEGDAAGKQAGAAIGRARR